MTIFYHGVFIFIFLAAIVLTCNLFTNAIEHLGEKLHLGDSATGSILAAIGTALPETILPLVAIIGSKLSGNLKDGIDIGTGSILGSSFLLSTCALFISGLFFYYFFITKKRKEEFFVPYENVIRDYKFFIFGYLTAIISTFIQSNSIKTIIGCFLICYWFFYVYRTLKNSASDTEGENLEPLYILFFNRNLKTNFFWILFQTVLSLILLVVFSKLFVSEIQYFSNLTKVNPLLISLILSPVATELPEITNSIIWIKNNKDTLAISNITGALVFQCSVCCSIGLIFTDWKFNNFAIVNILSVIFAAVTTLVLILKNKKLTPKALIFNAIWYFVFIGYVIFNVKNNLLL